MKKASPLPRIVTEAYDAAMDVLLNNLYGPFHKLPRTAGWGYPEPYTRDMMIAALGMLASGHPKLIRMVRRMLKVTAGNQTSRGHIPSYIHDPGNKGASDTTPLFLMLLAIYREFSGEDGFLEEEAKRSLTWMEYQSAADRVIVSHMPTTDWRDEHWVMGYGVFVNSLVYTYLRLFDQHHRANELKGHMEHLTLEYSHKKKNPEEGIRILGKPYLALWSFKIYSDEHFDLLGNSIAILSHIVSPTRAGHIIDWLEHECTELRQQGELAVDLPPCLIPYMQPDEPDWHERYAIYNLPGEYHNGGIWPFICGFYIAALVSAGRMKLARKKLVNLAKLVRGANTHKDVKFGFSEYYKAQNAEPKGQDWQTWSASMFIYAAKCVEAGEALYFPENHQGTEHGKS